MMSSCSFPLLFVLFPSPHMFMSGSFSCCSWSLLAFLSACYSQKNCLCFNTHGIYCRSISSSRWLFLFLSRPFSSHLCIHCLCQPFILFLCICPTSYSPLVPATLPVSVLSEKSDSSAPIETIANIISQRESELAWTPGSFLSIPSALFCSLSCEGEESKQGNRDVTKVCVWVCMYPHIM